MLALPRGKTAALPASTSANICAICDGLDAVMTLASYSAQHPQPGIRTDLTFAQALEALAGQNADAFDHAIIAPKDQKEATPQLLLAIIAAACSKAKAVTLLLPAKSRIAIPPQPRLRVLQGPAFTPLPPAKAPPPAQPRQLRRRLFRLPWRRQNPATETAPPASPPPEPPPELLRLLAFQPLSGGAGATSLAVQMALQWSQMQPALSVCLIDLNLQFGNVGTYLNLPASSLILDAYRDIGALDLDAFQHCLHPVNPQLQVFAAPDEILPLDALDAADLQHLLQLAAASADLVLIDLPHAVTDLTGALLRCADCILAICTLDVRAAQNAAKLAQLCQDEALPPGRIAFILNKTPAKPDALARQSQAAFVAGLHGALLANIPDGGPALQQACDAGAPLQGRVKLNPAHRAIAKLCADLQPRLGRRAAKTTATEEG